jgi:hypothetical protein
MSIRAISTMCNRSLSASQTMRLFATKQKTFAVVATIENYKFQFNPLSIKHDLAEIVLAVEVSGTFDGSPVTLDYHFAIEKDKIMSLAID